MERSKGVQSRYMRIRAIFFSFFLFLLATYLTRVIQVCFLLSRPGVLSAPSLDLLLSRYDFVEYNHVTRRPCNRT